MDRMRFANRANGATVWIRRATRLLGIVAGGLISLSLTGWPSPPAVAFGLVGVVTVALNAWLLYVDLTGRRSPSTKGSTMTEWWYNNKTKQVEEGPQSLGSDRDGPYASRAEAERAPEIAAERARKWAAEDD